MSPWWLLLIVPAALLVGAVFAGVLLLLKLAWGWWDTWK